MLKIYGNYFVTIAEKQSFQNLRDENFRTENW